MPALPEPLPADTICGSVSEHPVTMGQRMHEAGYQALSLPFRYVPFRAVPSQAPRVLDAMRTLHIRGLGLSAGFKEVAMSKVDALHPDAQAIGAINTVVNTDGRLLGMNTDGLGALRALEEVTPMQGKRVLLLGAAGAARAIAWALANAGADVHVFNRTQERAHALQSLGVTVLEAPIARGVDVVVNATRAGMTPDTTTPIPEEELTDAPIVMDIVYRPMETPLVRIARARGCRVITGERMLLHQAAAQFEAYTGHRAPLPAMEAALTATG